MLTPRDLITIRAALRYWQEEMCPYGKDAMQSYLDVSDLPPLRAAEIDSLRQRLLEQVRYIRYDVKNGTLVDTQLLSPADIADRPSGHALATVILP